MNIERVLVKPIRNRLRQSSSTKVSVKNNEDLEVVSRYPKRGHRKNYKEDDLPDDFLCKLFLMFCDFWIILTVIRRKLCIHTLSVNNVELMT